MSSPHTLRAVIFDLDGILCDTSRYHGLAWANLVRELGHEPPPDLEERVKGISRLTSLKIALGANVSRYSEAELVAHAERKNEAYRKAIEGMTPAGLFAGVRELFADLRRAGIRIALGSASKNAATVLDRLGLSEAFDAVADGHAYVHGKPHPDVFLTAARTVGAAPQECIVVEDAAAGIDAALDGGFVTVGMGAPESLRHAHLLIRSLTEVDAASLIELHGRCRPDRWSIVREGVHPEREDSLATLFTLGNGFLGVRGSLPGAGQGIFAAGLYDRVNRGRQDTAAWSPFMHYWGVAELARDEQIEVCLINCPDFLALDLSLDGVPLDWTALRVRRAIRRLDMHAAVMTADMEYELPGGGRLALTQRRFADAVHPERVFSQYIFETTGFSGRLGIRSRIRGATVSRSYGSQSMHRVTGTEPAGERSALLHIRGNTDGMTASFGAALRVPDRPQAPSRVVCSADEAAIAAEAEVSPGHLLYVEHVAVVITGRQATDPAAACRLALQTAAAEGFGVARIASVAEWRSRWARSDIRIEGNPADQLAARHSVYHLLLSAPTPGSGVSIAAKGLSGDGYRGMVFWDTDIHMTPFFNFTQPEMARELARFRWLTLDGARRKAARYGFRGAFYPWETGVSGDEECEKWLKLITHQSHITGDVAYALQAYVDATGDRDFYENHAAEVLIETARFWMSKRRGHADGTFSIPDAGGPDEYHVVCDDSAYVLHLAALNLRLADRAVRHLREHAPDKLSALFARTGATESEVAAFAPAAESLRTMQRPDGLLEQCAGFFSLRDEVNPHEGGPRPFETQCVKQADVVMLLYLLPDRWPAEVASANFDYYEPRTIHASSLSHAVHGILAARRGRMDMADRYIRRSLGMDLKDEMNNTALGAHMAALGMNWSAIVRGYAGCAPGDDVFRIDTPRLPADWSRLRFRLLWRGADFEVDIAPGRVAVSNHAGALPLWLCGRRLDLAPGASASCDIAGR